MDTITDLSIPRKQKRLKRRSDAPSSALPLLRVLNARSRYAWAAGTDMRLDAESILKIVRIADLTAHAKTLRDAGQRLINTAEELERKVGAMKVESHQARLKSDEATHRFCQEYDRYVRARTAWRAAKRRGADTQQVKA